MSHPPQSAQTISLSFQALCPTQVPAPCPACLSPLLLPALAQGCGLVWPPSFCCCHVEGQTLQAGTRFAGVRCRMAMGQPGLVAKCQWGEEVLPTPLPGVHATLPVSSCVSLCPACMLPCHALEHLLARGCSVSSVLAWPD